MIYWLHNARLWGVYKLGIFKHAIVGIAVSNEWWLGIKQGHSDMTFVWLLKVDLFWIFCQIKNIDLSKGNKWLHWHSIFGSVLEERNSDCMGLYDLINWYWCQTSHVLNFNICPQCFHHTRDFGAIFWWF